MFFLSAVVVTWNCFVYCYKFLMQVKLLMANQPGTAVVDKQRKGAMVIGISVPSGSNTAISGRSNMRSLRNTKG